ncbi:hypothetical protein FIBSPDRAFT_902251 [Athelia psychrophila]|uniref:Uncharacterized protein n=1 Tax=Athelia psychrophila TaxID=1759441 RepID=A0A167XFZ3_9AGAM|nr:hypothetical protein FIBSPDRAFT_902251 [Fibularhizoctonia sp. CBS 109695]
MDVYLSNLMKFRWEEDINPIPESDKVERGRGWCLRCYTLRAGGQDLPRTGRRERPSGFWLSSTFPNPGRWPDLIDQLTASLSLTKTTTNACVLETAHSFVPWRAHVRSDALFSAFSYVLSRSMDPFLQPFRHTVVPVPTCASDRATDDAAAGDLLRLHLSGPAVRSRTRTRSSGSGAGVFIRVLSWNAGAMGEEEEEAEGRRGW